MLGFQSLTLLFTRQQVTVSASHTPFRELVRVIGRNDQLLWAAGAMLCFMGGYMTVTSLGIYYFKYVYRDEAAYSVFAAILAVTQLAGLALFPLVRRFLRRFQIHTLATLLCLVALVVFWFADSSLAVVAVAGVLLFTGQAFIQLLMLMFIADCVEYGQWKLGRRNESVTLAVQPFIYKASNAIGSGFVGLALLVSGISGAGSPDDVTAGGIAAFKSVMMVVPMLFIAGSWLILRAGYRLDEKRYAEILAELESGKAAA
jgi:sugar transporter